MNTAAEILSELGRRHIALRVESGQLRVEAPKGALTADVRDALRARKTELIALLGCAASKGATPCASTARATPVAGGTVGLQATLARIWADVLQLDSVPVDANFFDLGGYSQLGSAIVTRVQEELAVELTLRDLFVNPTVERLSVHVEGLRNAVAVPSS